MIESKSLLGEYMDDAKPRNGVPETTTLPTECTHVENI
jgi:hypothetical protein